MPDEDFDVRERMSKTLSGIGGVDCPAKASCQLEVLRALEERDERWERRLQGLETRLDRVYGILEQWIGAKGIKNTDSTPATAPKGQAEIKTKDVRVRAPVWATLAFAVLLVVAVAIWQIDEIAKLVK